MAANAIVVARRTTEWVIVGGLLRYGPMKSISLYLQKPDHNTPNKITSCKICSSPFGPSPLPAFLLRTALSRCVSPHNPTRPSQASANTEPMLELGSLYVLRSVSIFSSSCSSSCAASSSSPPSLFCLLMAPRSSLFLSHKSTGLRC